MSNRDKSDSPVENRILDALPKEVYKALLAKMRLVGLGHGDVLYDIGQAIQYVYLPTDAVVSLVHVTRDGISVEVGLVGMEGVVGIPIVLGAMTSPYRAVVLVSGSAFRMKASVLREEFNKAGPLQNLLHRYTHGLMMQISCTVVCNRVHRIEERLARWLLMVQDRLLSDQFRLTHEIIADMLGVRRAGVSLAAGTLQKAGLIRYVHGKITILDRKGLEDVACECYGISGENFLEIGKR